MIKSLLLAVLLAATPPVAPHHNVYVMRHLNTPAGQADPDLLPEGQRSAEALASFFGEERPVAIYVTDYRRTRETVAPLAARLGITPQVYDPGATMTLIARVWQENGPVLIVGHSNTVRDVIQGLGGTELPPPLGHEDFGDVWRVAPDGTVTHMRLDTR